LRSMKPSCEGSRRMSTLAAPEIMDAATSASEWRDYDGLVGQLRSWVEARGISYALLDELAGLAKGHSGKLLGDAQVRQFSSFSLLAVMATLGLKCRFEEDPEMVEQMRPHWVQCDSAQRRTCRQARIGKTTMARVFPIVSKEIARRGGEARKAKLTPAQRSEIARKAGKASGRARLRRGLMEAAGTRGAKGADCPVKALGFAESKPSAKGSYRRPQSGRAESFCPDRTG
jgi:general stress protein YciG